MIELAAFKGTILNDDQSVNWEVYDLFIKDTLAKRYKIAPQEIDNWKIEDIDMLLAYISGRLKRREMDRKEGSKHGNTQSYSTSSKRH